MYPPFTGEAYTRLWVKSFRRQRLSTQVLSVVLPPVFRR